MKQRRDRGGAAGNSLPRQARPRKVDGLVHQDVVWANGHIDRLTTVLRLLDEIRAEALGPRMARVSWPILWRLSTARRIAYYERWLWRCRRANAMRRWQASLDGGEA
jgi:hypothetical protein